MALVEAAGDTPKAMAKAQVREWVPEEGKPAERGKPPKPKHTEKTFVGKKVLIRFMDGSSLTGTVLEFHTYTLAVEMDGKPILIYKHAIKAIEEVRSP
ncbi:RNA chaperone Hfq [Candidatus Bipolaricaulota bacterium]|nr:RNA chaperone Hfq [Candidatus Bipolaricaulota bacterium]